MTCISEVSVLRMQSSDDKTIYEHGEYEVHDYILVVPVTSDI